MDGTHAASRDRIKALYAERSVMESEMAEIAQRLSGPGMPGLRGSLVDGEGFPIPGVDLYAVRRGTLFFLFSFFFGAKQSIPNTRAFPLSPLSLSPSLPLSLARITRHHTKREPNHHVTPRRVTRTRVQTRAPLSGRAHSVRYVPCGVFVSHVFSFFSPSESDR